MGCLGVDLFQGIFPYPCSKHSSSQMSSLGERVEGGQGRKEYLTYLPYGPSWMHARHCGRWLLAYLLQVASQAFLLLQYLFNWPAGSQGLQWGLAPAWCKGQGSWLLVKMEIYSREEWWSPETVPSLVPPLNCPLTSRMAGLRRTLWKVIYLC